MKNILLENLVKNIIIIVALFFAHSQIQAFVFSPNFTADKSVIGSLLSVVSILAVTACFGNFAFTYEKIKRDSTGSRFLAHITTGLLMFLIGLSLEMTATFAQLLIGKFDILNLSFLILYIASVLYDFWDLKRVDL